MRRPAASPLASARYYSLFPCSAALLDPAAFLSAIDTIFNLHAAFGCSAIGMLGERPHADLPVRELEHTATSYTRAVRTARK